MALTLAGNAGFGLRASADVALNGNNDGFSINQGTIRPWAADADLIAPLGGRVFSGGRVAPYAFVGVGTATDGSNIDASQQNWSYGVGLSVRLGAAIDAFGESRWRMSDARGLMLDLTRSFGGGPASLDPPDHAPTPSL